MPVNSLVKTPKQQQKNLPKKKSEDQGDDDEKPATTKAKNPLDLIETKYDFYNFKTEYTNGKDKKVELEKFWATYD